MRRNVSWSLILSLTFQLLLVAAAIRDTKPSPRVFELVLSWEPYKPLGISRNMMLINGQTPGPELRFNQDDDVVVHVVNLSPMNTTLHFHGIEQYKTPWSDGVPGLTQRDIAPGTTFTYKFKATQHGNYWYHSHHQDQIEDGLYGSILIAPRPGADNPFHLISSNPADIKGMLDAERQSHTIALYDLMRISSSDKWDITRRSGIELSCSDRILFNGKGRINCLKPDDMARNLLPPQKGDLALVPGSKLTDKGCFPPNVMAAFGGDTLHFDESALPRDIFFGCNGTNDELEQFIAQPNTWLAFNILGSTNFVIGAFSIDEHDMWVYAVDGSYIEPQRVQSITVSNGERYAVLVRPTVLGDFKIRYNSVAAPQMITGYATLSVRELHRRHNHRNSYRQLGDSKPWISISGQPLSNSTHSFSDEAARPYPPDPIPRSANETHVIKMRTVGNSYTWALNSSVLFPSTLEATDRPMLFEGPSKLARNDNVTITTQNDTWVDLVLIASVYPMPPHPIHKHGNKMYMIGSGTGKFKWASVDEAVEEVPKRFNLVNPPRRDSFTTGVARKEVNWMVVRYHVTNPGPWLLHCHISNHMMGGMMMVLLDGVDAWPPVPDEYLNR